MKQTLFLMMGHPGSGKTTFAKALQARTKIVRVNADELRRYMYSDDITLQDTTNRPYVFGALDYACDVLLKAGVDVIQDSNTNMYEYRQSKAARVAVFDVRTIIINVETPIDVAREREKTRQLPDRFFRIDDAHYADIVATHEDLHPGETHIVLAGTQSFDDQYKSFCEQLAAIDGAK